MKDKEYYCYYCKDETMRHSQTTKNHTCTGCRRILYKGSAWVKI